MTFCTCGDTFYRNFSIYILSWTFNTLYKVYIYVYIKQTNIHLGRWFHLQCLFNCFCLHTADFSGKLVHWKHISLNIADCYSSRARSLYQFLSVCFLNMESYIYETNIFWLWTVGCCYPASCSIYILILDRRRTYCDIW